MKKNTGNKLGLPMTSPEPESRSMSVADALDRIACFARRGRLFVICGAGISMPGGLPGAEQLVKAILEWTSLNDAEKKSVSKIVPRFLPFERMMEIVLNTMPDNAKKELVGMFSHGSPGIVHTFLSEACVKGLIKTICTTNFDCHLEAALKNSKLKQGEQFVVYQDLDGLRTIDWSADEIRVLKLHGSIDRFEEMAVTVSKVADRTAAATLGAVMERIFGAGEDYAVLALGYSFSDRFDLSPTIERIGREGPRSSVLWVDHNEDETFGPEKAKLIEYRNVLADSDSLYLPNPLVKNPAAVRLTADTAWVVQELALRLGIEIQPLEKPKWGWKKYLKDFARDLDKKSNGILPDSLAGSFLAMIGDNETAIPYLKRAFEVAEKSGNEQVRVVTAQLLIGANLGAENFETAWKLLAKTEPIVQSLENGKHADYVLAQFGLLYKQLGEKCISLSLNYFRKAIDVCIREAVTGLQAVPHLAGAGSAWMRLGDMDAARQCYEQAYDIVKSGVDPTREAEVCGNLASLEYIVQNYQKALQWYDQAISLSHLAGDQRNEGIHSMNKANVFVKQKLYREALDCYDFAHNLLAPSDPLIALLDYHKSVAISRSDESRNNGSAGVETPI